MNFEKEIKNNELLYNILNALSEMIFIFDSSRKIKYVNDSVKDFIKKNRKEIVVEAAHGEILNCSFFLKDKGCGFGPFCSSCFIRESIEKVLMTGEALKDREGVITLKQNEGEKKLYIVISAVPLSLNNEKYAVLTMRDITKIKEYEFEKIKEFEKLSIIGSSAASIVHDLKNPLTGISGYVYLLEKDIANKENNYIFKKIENSLKRIQNMIEEILNIASGKKNIDITREEIVYESFMEEFFKDIRVNSKILKNVTYKEKLNIDTDKITQVLWNIIKNADEAISGNDGVISVEIYRKEDMVVTKISDNGKGIPEEIREKIFNAGHTFGKKGGKGFGLFSVKKIVEAHKGEIYFKSEEGKGSEFYIILPI